MDQRDRAFQPTTNSVNDLIVGLMRVATAAAQDAAAATGMTSVGAIKNSSVAMTPTFKEHTAGYPKIMDFKIAELLSATYKVEVEEIGSATNLALIDEAIDSLETGTPIYKSVEALAEFATGGTLSLFSPYAQLKPSLNFNFGDDFSAAPFEFEALSNPAFVNKQLVYRNRVAAASRSVANQPITTDVSNLGIGMFQIRIGKPARRKAGVASLTPAQKRGHGSLWDAAVNTAVTASAVGPYTGLVDGAFIVEITDITGPIGDVTRPDGTTVADVDFSAGGDLGQGVTLTFSNVLDTSFAVGDIYVVGAYTASALSNVVTGITSPYSFLTQANNIGAIQSASLETNPTYKDHFSGYPKVKDLVMLESSTVTINTAFEEFNAGLAVLEPGYATSLFDMLFDASVNGTLYNVPVELVMNLVTGGTLAFWFPNCQISPEGEIAPGDDWGSMPFALEAQTQGVSASTRRLYRQALVQNI